MKPFRYCPSCGAELAEPDPAAGTICESCGRSWYRNPAPAASAVIVRDGRVLVVVRGIEPNKGRIDSPGGFLHVGEDPLEGLKREIREELGVEIAVDTDDFLGAEAHTYGDDEEWLMSMGFAAHIIEGEPRAADDVAEVRWVTLDELDDLDFAWEHNRRQTRKGLLREKEESEPR